MENNRSWFGADFGFLRKESPFPAYSVEKLVGFAI
ncbi:hypothetical protein LP7551_01902 [Roseibium album]|nr:hypothetical protein LP7551_01902 [Roseibium album]